MGLPNRAPTHREGPGAARPLTRQPQSSEEIRPTQVSTYFLTCLASPERVKKTLKIAFLGRF